MNCFLRSHAVDMKLKYSAADQALLGRELGAPPAQPYQNQPELSPGPHDVHVPSYPTGTRFL